MLLDLDREVLKEMGIQTMGDVISILKHARFVYEKVIISQKIYRCSQDQFDPNLAKRSPFSWFF